MDVKPCPTTLTLTTAPLCARHRKAVRPPLAGLHRNGAASCLEDRHGV